jgi:hypothetical protein
MIKIRFFSIILLILSSLYIVGCSSSKIDLNNVNLDKNNSIQSIEKSDNEINNINLNKGDIRINNRIPTIVLEKGDLISQKFIDSIKTCTPYSERFYIEKLEIYADRRINGVKNGLCNYVESLFENQILDCYYPISMGENIATHFELLLNASEVETYVSTVNGSLILTDHIDAKEFNSTLTDKSKKSFCNFSFVNISDRLLGCEDYIIDYQNPFSGLILPTEVKYIGDGQCLYKESLLNGTIIECIFSENDRKLIAESPSFESGIKSVFVSKSPIITMVGEKSFSVDEQLILNSSCKLVN